MKFTWLAFAGTAVLICGCETTTTTSGGAKPHRIARSAVAQPDDVELAPADNAPVEHLAVAGQEPSSPLGPKNGADAVLTTDVSGVRIGDIMTALLEYYRFNHAMPARLADLRTIGGIDMNIDNESGRPFVYVPAGLALPGVRKLLVVYDPDVKPDHTVWCILMTPPAAGVAPTGEVIQLKDVVVQAYLKGSQ